MDHNHRTVLPPKPDALLIAPILEDPSPRSLLLRRDDEDCPVLKKLLLCRV